MNILGVKPLSFSLLAYHTAAQKKQKKKHPPSSERVLILTPQVSTGDQMTCT